MVWGLGLRVSLGLRAYGQGFFGFRVVWGGGEDLEGGACSDNRNTSGPRPRRIEPFQGFMSSPVAVRRSPPPPPGCIENSTPECLKVPKHPSFLFVDGALEARGPQRYVRWVAWVFRRLKRPGGGGGGLLPKPQARVNCAAVSGVSSTVCSRTRDSREDPNPQEAQSRPD